jgi:alpha-amylase
MKKLFTTMLVCLSAVCTMAQGWPENYGGVMLQGFYWDYYDDAGWGTWKALEGQASDLEGYIDLIWVPNSGQVKTEQWNHFPDNRDMGYMPCYWLEHNTCFGTQADLKSMIATYKSKGIGIIEDVVINHKNGQNDWCDFPNESVQGASGSYTLNWTLADICYNDNGGDCRAHGNNVTGAADTGDDFDGCRDLDHTGANVQQNVKTYLDFLQKELGYTGFRYDMVKGYSPQYVGIYNAYAKPTFSVGEFWDNWDGTTWWVNGTKQNGIVQSAAFDFPLKFLINEAFNGSFNGDALSSQGMAGDNFFKRYSVTFVDNHDTYRYESIPLAIQAMCWQPTPLYWLCRARPASSCLIGRHIRRV